MVGQVDEYQVFDAPVDTVEHRVKLVDMGP